MEHKKMRVKNAITTIPQTERVNQKSAQPEIRTLLILIESIVNRITVWEVIMRLIDPDEIRFVLAPIAPFLAGGSVHYEIVAFQQEVDAIRRIEAEPVKHAHWIDQKHGVYKCSNCRNYLDFRGVNAGRGDANYCPNCGAEMDGG